jgi:O-methyltransferase
MNLYGNKIDSLLSSDRIANLIKYSQACANLGGYISEWGTYHGGGLEVLARFNPGIDIIGVDSFEGVGPASAHDRHQEGDFAGIDVRKVIGYFSYVYPTVRIVKGFIPDVLSYFDGNTRFSFSHVDLDMYEAVKHASDFLFPRTISGGMILYDDYNQNSTPGATKAIDEFYQDKDCAFKGELFYYEGGQSHKQYLVVVR